MLSEVDTLYNDREDFAFVAWSPHWMNQKYDFRFLTDPQDALEELNDPAELSTIIYRDFPEEQPAPYAFMEAITLDEEQLNDLEATINEAGDPLYSVGQKY